MPVPIPRRGALPGPGLLAGPRITRARNLPRPVRIVGPFPPRGIADLTARPATRSVPALADAPLTRERAIRTESVRAFGPRSE